MGTQERMATERHHDEEDDDFVDVPDPISDVSIVARTASDVTLEWAAPCSNNCPIAQYQFVVQPWLLGETLLPLPVNASDEAHENLTLLEVNGADVDASSKFKDCCHFKLQKPAFLKRASCDLDWKPCSLDACWVAVRASNSEGWSEWSSQFFVLFRSCRRSDPFSALYTWGVAEDGRLGRGYEVVERGVCAEAGMVQLENEAIRVSTETLSLGAHSAIITDEDRLFTWGTFEASLIQKQPEVNDGEKDLWTEPAEQRTNFVAHNVTCGRFVTVVLSAGGDLFAWGPNSQYQCGIDGPDTISVLTQLQIPNRAPVIQVALGEHHGLALTSHGVPLAWGMEQSPALNLGTSTPLGFENGTLPAQASFNQASPRVVEVQGTVVRIAAGGFHSALITRDGKLWTWGQNARGQLGLIDSASSQQERGTFLGGVACHEPRPVQALVEHTIIDVSLGGFHSAAIDSEGKLYTWGDNKRGQCGQGDVEILHTPTQLMLGNDVIMCIGVSCGGFFSFFKAKIGERRPHVYFASGWGKEGCLGFGQICKRLLKPRQLPKHADGRQWTHIEAGMVHAAGFLT